MTEMIRSLVFFISVWPVLLVWNSAIGASLLQRETGTVKVRVLAEQGLVEVSGKGLHVQVNGQSAIRSDGKLFWSFDQSEIKSLSVSGLNVAINGKRLPSNAEVVRRKNGFEVIAELPLEMYVFGVLISEIPPSWPLEALKAQAIAIRSYTLARKNENRDEAFALEATILDQVFKGFHAEDIRASKYRTARQAINETEGIVLVDSKDSRITKAYFHSDCGGATLPPEAVWGSEKNSNDVPVAQDPMCRERKANRWEVRLGSHELPAELAEKGIRWKDAFWDLSSQGRLKQIVFKAQAGFKKIWTAQNLREYFGFSKVRSSKLEIKTQGSEVLLRGQGFGHGVGLCQWGSKDWATQGKLAADILTHYYPFSRLKFPRALQQRWAGAQDDNSSSF